MRKTTVSDTGLVDTTFPPEWSAETKSEIGGRVLEGGAGGAGVYRYTAEWHSGTQASRPALLGQMPHTDHQPQINRFHRDPRTGSQARENGVQKHNGTLIRTTQSPLH